MNSSTLPTHDCGRRHRQQSNSASHKTRGQLYRVTVELVATAGPVAELGSRQAELWAKIDMRLDDGEAALVVTHGRLIEPGLVAALPGWAHERWARGFRQCEGARLTWDGAVFTDAVVFHLS